MDIITYFDTFLAYFLLFLFADLAGGAISDPRPFKIRIFTRITFLSRQKIKNRIEFFSRRVKILPYCPLYNVIDIYCAQFMHSGDMTTKFVRIPDCWLPQNGI
jgi:hypothetical protein